MERIILTTGGTGGHIFPALAVAEEIRKRHPEAMILFMGGEYGPEADIVTKAGLDFVGLPVKGVLGRGLRGFFAAFGMLGGIMKARGVIRKVKPQMVVGFGGYAAFAGVLAGKLSGAATAIHEQNGLPGLTNQILSKLVDRIFLSMPDAASAFPREKTELVGNPVRAAIAELYEERVREDAQGASGTDGAVSRADGGRDGKSRGLRLLVMGGSQGARAINRGLLAVVSTLLDAGFEIRHQTGAAEYEQIRAEYRRLQAEHVQVEPFIGDMGRAYAWADLVLCRAGGSSMAELTCAGVPVVLVPLPQAARDHQRYNARFLERAGGAVILEQELFYGSNGRPEALAEALVSLAADRERLREMAQRSLAAAQPYAARTLVDGLEKLLRG